MSGLMKSFYAAAAVAALSIGSATHAATIVASDAPTQISSGDNIDGWQITFPVGVNLVYDGGSHITLEKFADFSTNEGLDIRFTQLGLGPTDSELTITDETLTNMSSTTWSGFKFLLMSTGGTANATFGSGFNLDDPSLNKFTSENVQPTSITFGGTLADTQTSQMGFGATGGEVDINAAPSSTNSVSRQVVDFKEIPVVAAVPLPEASWMGLSGLIGLGLIAHGKKIKNLLA